MDKSKLNQFTETEQVKLASFVVNFEKNEMDHVDESNAKAQVKKWKTCNNTFSESGMAVSAELVKQ